MRTGVGHTAEAAAAAAHAANLLANEGDEIQEQEKLFL